MIFTKKLEKCSKEEIRWVGGCSLRFQNCPEFEAWSPRHLLFKLTWLFSHSAKEVKKAPVILEKLQNSGVPEGHPVRLECRVIGMPPPVFYWKKDNETIPFTRERIRYSLHTWSSSAKLIRPPK